jgi:hypothetical protein
MDDREQQDHVFNMLWPIAVFLLLALVRLALLG